MNSPRRRTRSRFQLETLEGRIALSHMGAAVEDGPHRNRGGQPAEVHTQGHGADDPVNHNANDDKGGTSAAVHQHRGGTVAARGGQHVGEHPAGHP